MRELNYDVMPFSKNITNYTSANNWNREKRDYPTIYLTQNVFIHFKRNSIFYNINP